MDLAAEGFPQDGETLDILQQGTGFGMTESDKQIYRRYQLQKDLETRSKPLTVWSKPGFP